MTNILKKKDFIEIDFIGKTEEGKVFDSNIREELEKLGSKIPPKSFTYSLGENMFLDGIDEYLEGKSPGKYEITLEPEKAFGKRNPQLIKTIPLSAFKGQPNQPQTGMMFNFDGNIAKIVSVSGGRVMADFNHPLAGKKVIYEIDVKRKISDLNEKVKALMNFFFRKEFNFEIKEEKIIVQAEKDAIQFLTLFADKFKDILEKDFEIVSVIENKDKKENSN